MSKIKTLHINNFKFFRCSKPLDLNGRHLLLYGENGNGKSSVYYGLYTLLEAASKQPDSVRKYFDPDNDQSLVNIYADTTHGKENTGSYIQITDDAAHTYHLSFADLDCIANNNLLESNRASDFMNYVSLFQFQMFRSSEVSDLRDVFLKSILPSVSFPAIKYLDQELRGAMEMYRAYKAEPVKVKNPKGDIILAYKNSPEYKAYSELEAHFNAQMHALIDFINDNVNAKIEEFDYNFKVYLEYQDASHYKKDKVTDFTEFRIILRLIEYNGKPVSLDHPNTFLNEARMAALAFSIRWAVLDYRLQQDVAPDALKVLVLDDIMISLDMANREKLISIIINKLTPQYQVLFFTHDKQIFESMKHELMRVYHKHREDDLQETDWFIQEMYDVESAGVHEPIFQPSNSHYARALRYFQGKDCLVDNVASGNAIRQAIEGAFKELFLKANIRRNSNGDPIEISSLMISDCIEIARKNLTCLGLSDAFMNKIDGLRECLFNPASHHNPGRNFYRQELKEAFRVCETLFKCDHRVVVPKGEEVKFLIIPADGVHHDYTVRLKQDLVAFRFVDSFSYQYYWNQGRFLITDSADPKIRNKKIRKRTLDQVYYESFEHFLKRGIFKQEDIPDILGAVTYNGKTLQELLLI